jgi:transposase
MNITCIGLDLAKHVFQIHAVERDERIVHKRQLRRSQLLACFVQLPPCRIGMEACAGAHHWARASSAAWATTSN